MKQTIEVDMLDGYKFSHKIENIVYNGQKTTLLFWKKEPTKDFNWYVDKYLTDDQAPTSEIRNWIADLDLACMIDRLQKGQFKSVPWEIKIGLFKFILSQDKKPVGDITNFHIVYSGGGDIGRSRFSKITDICPVSFLDSLFDETK